MLTTSRVFALDSLAQSCGLSLPTLFKRIGSMAAYGQYRPRNFTPRACSAGSTCGDPSLPDTPATLRSRHGGEAGTGGAGKTACEDNSGLHRVPDRPTARQPRYGWRGQGVHRPITAHAANRRVQRGPPAKTTPTSIASGPSRAPSQARGLDNRIRMGIVLPSHRLFWREPMTARASPID
jgi:hypothetical protein